MKSLGIFALGLSAAAVWLAGAGTSVAQEAAAPATNPLAKAPEQARANAITAPGVRLTLQDALARARKNSVQFQAAMTDSAIARQDRFQAGAALLPSVAYNNEALYTQLNQQNSIKFIANNAAHEYISLANVHESIDLAGISEFRRAIALAAAAKARAEVASRGLVVTVVQGFYSVAAAQQKP